MKWTQQKEIVDSLSGRAQDKRREARHIRANLHRWTNRYLGSTEALIWLFAAGTFVASGLSSPSERSATRRSMIAAINTSLLGWQLVNRQLNFNQPEAANSPE